MWRGASSIYFIKSPGTSALKSRSSYGYIFTHISCGVWSSEVRSKMKASFHSSQPSSKYVCNTSTGLHTVISQPQQAMGRCVSECRGDTVEGKSLSPSFGPPAPPSCGAPALADLLLMNNIPDIKEMLRTSLLLLLMVS